MTRALQPTHRSTSQPSRPAVPCWFNISGAALIVSLVVWCCVALLCFSLLGGVDVQGCVQSVRKLLLDCLSVLFSCHPLLVCDDAPAVLSGFVAAVDGEKDPRCLIVVFALAAFILRQAPTEAVTDASDALFDVIGCYFPITFTPPANDPHHITRDELRHALRAALTAHPALNAQLVPLLLDKMDDTTTAVRLDALTTLHAALTCGDGRSGSELRASIAPFFQDLVTAIKRAWIAGNEKDVQQQLALCLTDTVRLLCPNDEDANGEAETAASGVTSAAVGSSSGTGISDSLLANFRSALFSELVDELRVPDSKVARAYADMTQPICVASGQHTQANI